MGGLGIQEILIIGIILLLVFGPRKLPEIGKQIGRGMAEFKRASNDFKRTVSEEVESENQRSEVERAKAAVSEKSPPPPLEP